MARAFVCATRHDMHSKTKIFVASVCVWWMWTQVDFSAIRLYISSSRLFLLTNLSFVVFSLISIPKRALQTTAFSKEIISFRVRYCCCCCWLWWCTVYAACTGFVVCSLIHFFSRSFFSLLLAYLLRTVYTTHKTRIHRHTHTGERVAEFMHREPQIENSIAV